MPFKDPEKKRKMNLQYSQSYGEREKAKGKPAGLCSVTGCTKPTAGTNRKCDHHLAYMREYKKKYRAQAKAPGTCNNTDCQNPAREGFKLCDLCNERSKTKQKLPHVREQVVARSQSIQEEVLAAYGNKCVCCGLELIEFLSIDHIDGFNGKGPRKGGELYRWLKRNNYPSGFRVLCMSCNFALGHHGYCPHNNLTCHCPIGRPEVVQGYSVEEKKLRREAHIAFKKTVFAVYGGCHCACRRCTETNHECLQIDHIANNGAAHRKEVNGDARDGRNFYYWLRKNGFPPGYQVLCVNCNFAKGHFGVCPHEAS